MSLYIIRRHNPNRGMYIQGADGLNIRDPITNAWQIDNRQFIDEEVEADTFEVIGSVIVFKKQDGKAIMAVPTSIQSVKINDEV